MATMWCVEVRYEDDDPGIFGPYTKAQAQRVAGKLEAEAELANSEGFTLHTHNVAGATAYPMQRYNQFLSTEERREARRARREYEKRPRVEDL